MSIYNLALPRESVLAVAREVGQGEKRLGKRSLKSLFGDTPVAGTIYAEDRKSPIPPASTYKEFGPTTWSQERRLEYYDNLPPLLKNLINRDRVGTFLDNKGREYIAPYNGSPEGSEGWWSGRIKVKLYSLNKIRTPKPNEVLELSRNGVTTSYIVEQLNKELRRGGTFLIKFRFFKK